jgi:hypothetical protein
LNATVCDGAAAANEPYASAAVVAAINGRKRAYMWRFLETRIVVTMG